MAAGAKASFLSTPWPWVIGGALVLLLFVGVSVGAAVMIWPVAPRLPAPVAFAGTTGTREAAQSLALGRSPVVVREAPPVGAGRGRRPPTVESPDGPGVPGRVLDAFRRCVAATFNAVAAPGRCGRRPTCAATSTRPGDGRGAAPARRAWCSDKNLQSVLVLNGNGPAGRRASPRPACFRATAAAGLVRRSGRSMANAIDPLGPRGGSGQAEDGQACGVDGEQPRSRTVWTRRPLNTEWAAGSTRTPRTLPAGRWP